MSSILLTRTELYHLVWSKPMMHLAKEYDISDTGLRKICKRHSIPTPKAGYWAKLAHGKQVQQEKLSALPTDRESPIYLRENSDPELPVEIANELARMEAGNHQNILQIVVPDELPKKLHPDTRRLKSGLYHTKSDQQGFLNLESDGLIAVTIGPESVNRVLRIINSLLESAESLGYKSETSNNSHRLLVQGEPFTVRVYEGKDKTPHVPTPRELKEQASRDKLNEKYPGIYSTTWKVYRKWDYSPSGKLTLEIRDPSQPHWYGKSLIGRWRDRGNKSLEEYLATALNSLPGAALLIRHQREEKIEQQRREAEELHRRQQAEARAERANRRHVFLKECAAKLSSLRQLQLLAEHFQTGISGNAAELQFVTHLLMDLNALIDLEQSQLTPAQIDSDIARLQLYVDEDLD